MGVESTPKSLQHSTTLTLTLTATLTPTLTLTLTATPTLTLIATVTPTLTLIATLTLITNAGMPDLLVPSTSFYDLGNLGLGLWLGLVSRLGLGVNETLSGN